MGEAQIGVLVEIVAAALQRNYPEATPDMVENLLDLGNASAVLNAVLTGSGLKLSDNRLGEAPAPGSRPGARVPIVSSAQDPVQEIETTGDISMVSSPLPAAIATP